MSKLNKLTTKRFVIRKSLIGENTIITLDFSGTSSSNDYLGLTSIIVAAGELTGTENLNIVNDTIFETNETIISGDIVYFGYIWEIFWMCLIFYHQCLYNH